MKSRRGENRKGKDPEKTNLPIHNAINSFDWISTKLPKA